MTSAAQGLDELQIECAKPECHWKGPPAEAPTHPCPTPDPDAQIAALAGDPERETLVQTLTAAGVSFDPATSIDGLRELAALTGQPQAQTGLAATIDAGTDPTTREEIEEWLLAHGRYDDAGVPQDEKTATIDARLGAFLEDPDEAEPELEITAENLLTEPAADVEPGDVPEQPIEAQRPPWEPTIAKALETQPEVAAYRWLIVWKPEDVTRDAELIARARVKTDAQGLLKNVLDRGELQGEVTIEKTQAVLEAAAEIEKRRELVEEPDRTVEPEPAPEPELEPEEPKPAPAPEPDAKKGELFSAADYDREDLAISKVDGHGIDRIALAFSGSVMLDRSNPDHVALFNRAKIGADLDLWVNAAGAGVQTKPNTNRDGDLDVVVSTRSLRIDTVRILAPAELENAKDEIAAQARDAHEAGEDRAAK